MTASYEIMSTLCSAMPNVPRPAASIVSGHAARDTSSTRVTETVL